ncbi:MAG: hypothetical protein F6J90_29575 [Moorea sp. SIOASIH]|nr:hypothetical protein [Moorena sp. SIOASIH]
MSSTLSFLKASRDLGKHSAVSGQRSVVSGQRSAVSGQRSAVSGQPLVFSCSRSVRVAHKLFP